MSKYYTKTETLQRYGWTNSSLARFMSKPDRKYPNPYNNSSYVQLFRTSRVHNIEKSKEWREWLGHYARILERSGSSVKAMREVSTSAIDRNERLKRSSNGKEVGRKKNRKKNKKLKNAKFGPLPDEAKAKLELVNLDRKAQALQKRKVKKA